MDGKPLSSSTPTYLPTIRGRKTYQKDETISPISSRIPESSKMKSKSETSESDTSDSDITPDRVDHSIDNSGVIYSQKSKSIPVRTPLVESKDKNILQHMLMLVFFTAVVIYAFSSSSFISFATKSSDSVDIRLSIEKLKSNFPEQGLDTWNAIESGIYEVKTMSKPSVFLFVYDKRAEHLLLSFVKNVTVYFSCVLNDDCTIEPVELNGTKLSNSKIYSDYGNLIHKYRQKVEERSVMVIHNLEKIPGELAQAFHSFCDEFNPLVGKSVYLFTMKVDKAGEGNLETVERILHQKWSDLKDDIFYPLFTRISSMVITVRS